MNIKIFSKMKNILQDKINKIIRYNFKNSCNNKFVNNITQTDNI